jgi:hypothetical protein
LFIELLQPDLGSVLWALIPASRSLAHLLIQPGVILLAATVIADAITKAQGTREGP